MAKPKLAYIPATIGDKVYSILPSDGVGDFDFTRASTATRINAQGLIEEVASGENRLNYSLLDGEVVGCPHLLLEDEATNLITYSENFSNTPERITITNNVEISPDGTTNAASIVEDSQSGRHRTTTNSFAVAGGSEYTLSMFAKIKSGNRLLCLNADFIFDARAYFDLENGVVAGIDNGSASIEYYGNGWYRCSVTGEASGSTTSLAYIGLEDGTSDSGYQGDGTSGHYWFGLQVEQSSFITSYIKTNGTTVTRAAETCTNSGDANTFNGSEGVLMAEISALADTVPTYTSIGLGINSGNERIGLGFEAPSDIYVFKRTNTSWINSKLSNINESNKVAISYNTNDNHFWLNGFKIASNTTIGDLVQPTELDFQASYGGEQFYGNTKQIQYFDTTDIDLEELTSWDSFRAMAQSQLYSVE